MNIPKLATIRIRCKQSIGSALLHFPAKDPDYAYILTAKHCLSGNKFDQTYSNKDVQLDKIFNPLTGILSSYHLSETDRILVSADDALDLAIIVVPKQRIVELTGAELRYQAVDTDMLFSRYELRGFSSFDENEHDRLFELSSAEERKGSNQLFTLHSDASLHTYYVDAQDNMQGTSGGGIFAVNDGRYYLVGIMQEYEDGNVFVASNVRAYNELLASNDFPEIQLVRPEIDPHVLATFRQIELNLKQTNMRIREYVGEVHIDRDPGPALEMLRKYGLCIIGGKQGTGKSGLAKLMARRLQQQQETVLTFTVEQMYCDTLAEVLTKAGYSTTMEQILSSAQVTGKVVVWIDSFEKLMESGLRGAFKELLHLVKGERISLLLTMREYQLQSFKITFRHELPEGTYYYLLDVFSQEQMKTLRDQIPELVPLLDNPKLSELLSNAYYLDQATRILPELINEDQLDEERFMNMMMKYIVEAGNPKRGKVFYRTCLKRARELSLFTSSEESADILADLVRDGILQRQEDVGGHRYSPSHDILEDIALTAFIQDSYNQAENSLNFILYLEQNPAIRRAFRLWLDRFFISQPERSAALVHQLLTSDAPQEIKDTLLTATLRSAHAGIVLDSLSDEMLEDKGSLLRKLIDLLQTGCKAFSQSASDFDQLAPLGGGWDYVITFIRRNLDTVIALKGFEFQYLEMIESWSKQLPDFNPLQLPAAAADAAFLLEDFLFRFQGLFPVGNPNKTEDPFQKKYLGILFRLTAAAPALVGGILNAAVDIDTEHPRWSGKGLLENVRSYVTEGMLADQPCRFFPSQIIQIAGERWAQPKAASADKWISGHDRADITDFGLNKRMDHELDAASGYQTFLFWMMLYHPDQALDFLMPFLEQAFAQNAQVGAQLGQKFTQIKVRFSDGNSRSYTGCREHWGLFRGTYPQNKLIASLLMALEKALLELGRDPSNKQLVKRLIDRLVTETSHVAVLGVVMSVLQAYPQLMTEISISLLGVKPFFLWDKDRFSTEFSPKMGYWNDMLFRQEREEENKRPHRRRYHLGMIGFVAPFMFLYGELHPRIFQLVDAMWADQGETQDYWRKFLYDIDVRKYEMVKVDRPGYEHLHEYQVNYDSKIQELIERDPVPTIPAANMIWISEVYDGKEVLNKTYSVWKTGYEILQSGNHEMALLTPAGKLAVIGLREFIGELSSQEQQWCREELFRYAEKQLKPRNFMDMTIDDAHAMMGLPYILNTHPSPDILTKTKIFVFRLLISPLGEQVKVGLIQGMLLYLKDSHPQFLRDCWYGLLALIERKEEAVEIRSVRRQEGYYPDPELGEPDATWLEQLTTSVLQGSIKPPAVIQPRLMNATEGLLNDALKLIPAETTLPEQQDFVKHFLHIHLDYLRDKNRYGSMDHFQGRIVLRTFYAKYLLGQVPQKASILFKELLDLSQLSGYSIHIKQTIDYVYELIRELMIAVNGGASVPNFWALWDQLRVTVEKVKDDQLTGYLLMSAINGADFKWHVLDGKILFYQVFLTRYDLPLIDLVLKFVSGVAFYNFMPTSIAWISTLLAKGKVLLNQSLLEDFVIKALDNYAAQIKSDKTILKDFLSILDYLMKKSSSKAFMVHDKLIQYK